MLFGFTNILTEQSATEIRSEGVSTFFLGKDDHKWDLPAGGTRLFKYRVTHKLEDSLQLNYLCATIMPEYGSWSLEELRLADHLIANFPQHCQFVNDGKYFI